MVLFTRVVESFYNLSTLTSLPPSVLIPGPVNMVTDPLSLFNIIVRDSTMILFYNERFLIVMILILC